jgi:hypothetical protein
MYTSVTGTFGFDITGGQMTGAEVSLVMNMHQQMQGMAETPQGPQAVDMEIITRDLTVDSTMEVAQ